MLLVSISANRTIEQAASSTNSDGRRELEELEEIDSQSDGLSARRMHPNQGRESARPHSGDGARGTASRLAEPLEDGVPSLETDARTLVPFHRSSGSNPNRGNEQIDGLAIPSARWPSHISIDAVQARLGRLMTQRSRLLGRVATLAS